MLKRASPVSLLKVIKDEINDNLQDNFLSRGKNPQLSFLMKHVLPPPCFTVVALFPREAEQKWCLVPKDTLNWKINTIVVVSAQQSPNFMTQRCKTGPISKCLDKLFSHLKTFCSQKKLEFRQSKRVTIDILITQVIKTTKLKSTKNMTEAEGNVNILTLWSILLS